MGTQRFAFDFTDEAVKSLDMLMRRFKDKTRAEVLRRALGLLDLIQDEYQSGDKLVIEKLDGRCIEVSPRFLDYRPHIMKQNSLNS